MPRAAKQVQARTFASAEEFEAAMFPRTVRERVAARERERPEVVGSKLGNQALARLKKAAEVARASASRSA